MKRHPDFIKRKIGTRYVIVALRESARRFNGMLSINATGSFIWELLEQETNMKAIVSALIARYEINEEAAAQDAEAFIEVLKGVGAVVEA